MNSIGPPSWPYKLGKKAARPGAIKFALWSYFNLDLPKPPDHFRHADPPKWHSYENEKYGNCVWVGAANETALWEHEGGNPTPLFSTQTVLSDYSAVAGFDPKRVKQTDNGTDMGEACNYRRQTGILDINGNRHKIDAYAWVQLQNMDHLKAAMWLLGGVGLGFIFWDYNMKQFEAHKVWDLEKSGKRMGGHYVFACGIAPNGNIICISWGKEIEMTPRMYMERADEIVACMDLDRLSKSTKLTPENYNEERLRHDIALVAKGRVYALNSSPNEWA